MIKAFISDIDETILTDGNEFASKEVETALLSLQQKEITLILATARGFSGTKKLMEQFQMEKYGGYIVCSNGSYIFDCQKKLNLYKATISMEIVEELYEFSKEYDLHMSSELANYTVISAYDEAIEFDWKVVGVDFFLPGNLYLEAISEEPFKIAFTYNKERLASILPLVEETFGEKLTVQLSMDVYIDLVPFGITKASGIKRILDLLGYQASEIAAIGDGNNDIPMFQLAGISAAVENASDMVKEYVDVIVSSCAENGVAEFAEQVWNTN